MTTDTKATRKPKADKAPTAPTPPKAPTKKVQVRDMMLAGPTSIAQIAERLAVGTIAARALIGDVRKAGDVTVTYDSKAATYSAAVKEG